MKTKIPDQFNDKGYISCSVDKSVALKFSNHQTTKCCLFEVLVPKGTKMIPLYTCSKHTAEIEVLLPRNGSYTIMKEDFTPKKNTMVIRYNQDLTKKFTISALKAPPGWTADTNFDKTAILTDPNGAKWKLQQPRHISDDNEYLGYALYQLFGVKVTPVLRLKYKGASYLLKKEVITNPVQKSDYVKAHKDFAIDALLANLNIAGANSTYINDKGEFVRHNLSGVLGYNSFGDVKPFAKNTIPELDRMRNPSTNPLSAAMFKDMTPTDLVNGIKRIRAVEPEKVRKYVNDFGFGSFTFMDWLVWI